MATEDSFYLIVDLELLFLEEISVLLVSLMHDGMDRTGIGSTEDLVATVTWLHQHHSWHALDFVSLDELDLLISSLSIDPVESIVWLDGSELGHCLTQLSARGMPLHPYHHSNDLIDVLLLGMLDLGVGADFFHWLTPHILKHRDEAHGLAVRDAASVLFFVHLV